MTGAMILRLIYSILYSIVLVFLLLFQYMKRPKELRKRWLKEKFGFFHPSLLTFKSSYPSGNPPSPPFSKGGMGGFEKGGQGRLIWIHAVSVGEVMAAIPFIFKLKERFNLLISTITDTGQKVASEKVPADIQVIYLPFDLVSILKRAFKNIRPSIFITMETELWPNLFATLKRQNVPVIIMNGRISEDSFKGYMKIRFFLRDIFGCVDLFGMQDSIYADRIKALGAPEDKVKVLGNFKFDTKPSENIPEWTKLLASPVVIAGSTHRGEEDLIISVFEKLKKDFSELNLIIAPRHPERFEEVKELAKSRNIPYIKCSKFHREVLDCERRIIKSQLIILDVVGELASVYAISDIAIIGGSFIPHGGQNLLEPAYWAKPIICGPYMENFPFVKEFYEKNAAIETDASGLIDRLKELLKYPEKRDAIGKMAKELYNEKAGAVERAVEEIERLRI